jgi:hypothetical protein
MDAQARALARAEEIRAKKEKLAEIKRARTEKAKEIQHGRASVGEKSEVLLIFPSFVRRALANRSSARAT